MEEYLTIKEFSKKWGIGERRINALCKEGRISGAQKFGNTWAIPVDAENRRICVLKVASISRKTSNDAAYESLLIGTISTGLEEG